MAHRALLLQLEEGVDHAAVFEFPSGRVAVDLDYIEIAGPEPAETLFDPRRHVLASVDVLFAAILRSLDADLARALRRQDDVGAPVLQRLADQLFAQPIVDPGVDVIDSEIDHAVDEPDGVALRDGAGARRTRELHGAVADPADDEVGLPHAPRPAGELGLIRVFHACMSPLAVIAHRDEPGAMS